VLHGGTHAGYLAAGAIPSGEGIGNEMGGGPWK
jgi:hypothetical protein